jgi:mRNA interferase RelE/StbE
MYELIYSKKALKYLNKLPKDIQERIIKTLERCRVRPHAFVKRLVSEQFFKLRVGDYRVIADINKNQLRILVIKIGHRKKIYKNKL